ncbi:MAG: deoxyribose-phosphate aldolase [Bacteroidales bacterium]|nr:deoxyribose-phosphate aldolase [Bacteroidales bacterium]
MKPSDLLQFIDLTTLNIDDTTERVVALCKKGITRGVAAICVYPSFVTTAKKELSGTCIKVASVAGCFPAAQSPIEIRVAEVKYAVKNGADEIDMVLPVGKLLEGNEKEVLSDIRQIKKACGKAHLKCILETGALKTAELISRASELAIEGEADFIKTSTGKISPAATPETASVMLKVIRKYYDSTGIKIGFKAAGGISTYDEAIVYVNLVRQIAGDNWLSPELFRIGASRLVDNLGC